MACIFHFIYGMSYETLTNSIIFQDGEIAPPTRSLLDDYLPSGKRLHSYGKSQFLMGKSTINGHCYPSHFGVFVSRVSQGYPDETLGCPSGWAVGQE